MALRNRWKGTCHNYRCREQVAPGEGYATKVGRIWVVFCNRSGCLPPDLLAAVEADNRRALTAVGKLYLHTDSKVLQLVRAFPGARFDRDGEKRWTVSLDPLDRPRVLELAQQLGLAIAPELLEVPKDPLAEAAAERARAGGAYPYQADGAAWLAPRQYALLADEQGLGKTAQALWALDPGIGAIVVTPASLKYHWCDECRRWRPDLHVEVLAGRGSFRWPAPGEVVILNPDILPDWPTKEVEQRWRNGDVRTVKVADVTPDVEAAAARCIVVADEAFLFKSYKAARTARMRELVRLCGRAWALTGTPLTNRPGDLWGLLRSFGMAGRAFGSWRTFEELFDREPLPGAAWGKPSREVHERMLRVMKRRTRAEVMPELPDKRYQTILIDVANDGTYRLLDRAWDRWGEEDPERRDLPTFDEIPTVRAALARARIPAMLEIVESHEDGDVPLVVFSAHRAPIDTLAARKGWRVITGDTSAKDRDAAVREFQGGTLKGIALTIQAGGVGITLTHAATALFVDLDWSPAGNAQAEDRICRIGQRADHVLIIRLTSRHPLEQRVYELLDAKAELIRCAIEGVPEPAVTAETLVVRHETDEEYRARMERLRQAAVRAEWDAAHHEREWSRGRIGEWLARCRARAHRPEPPLTPQVLDAVRHGLDYMLSVCDGAILRDDLGFDKFDTLVARRVAVLGLEDDDQLRLAERILSRYHRQLSEKFPVLFE